MHRAQCYYDMEQYEDATKDLQHALAQNAFDSHVLYKQGLTYYANSKYKKSIKVLKQSLRAAHEPGCLTYEPDIYYHIGLAYCRVEKFEKSIFPFSKCVEHVPSDIRYIHERAKAYQMIEMHEKAVEDFNVVIKKNPKNAHAHFRRAFSLKSLKVSPTLSTKIQKYAEAADDFESAKDLDPLNPKVVINYKKLKGVTCIVLCEPGEEKIFK